VLRILVVRFSSIGDVLLTTPLIRVLARRHPEAEIAFATKRDMAPLVADNPHVTQTFALEPHEPLGNFAARLRAWKPSYGLDLHGSLRSRALRLLVPGRWSGYTKRKIARRMLIATKLDLYRSATPVAERYFEAARRLDVKPDGQGPEFHLGEQARERVTRWLHDHGLQDATIAALAPGAAHATKRWPVAYWTVLAGRLAQAGLRTVVLGGPADRGLAQQLAAFTVSAAGEFSLQETGALLARSRILVSGDTGVMHMATGVGTPVVALFGPTVKQFGFFPYSAPAVVLERPLSCRPCSAMGSSRCPMGHHRCLTDIAPGDVAAAVERLVA
jgi:lipopolysaccharide heptosyltransferase II